MFLRRMLDRRKDSAHRQRLLNDRVDASVLAQSLRVRLSLLFSILLLSGCSSFSDDEDSGLFGRMTSIKGIRGPLERSLYGEESALELGRRYTEAERREARRCREAYDKGDFEQAIKLGKKTAKKFKESSLGEEAQFYLAESHYALGKYSAAQNDYAQLFEDYPSTRYVEPATRRLFSIARVWLEVAEPVARNEIRQVSGEKVIDEGPPPKPPLDPTLRVRVLPNFHDRSRPMFDTQGRALECLKSIWMNDPTGPLADDALMLTATYYQRHDNYVEADRYEGRELTGARKLKEQSLQLFPASHQRQQLRKDLDQLYLLEAQRAWSKVEYYQKKGRPRAVAIACIQLLSEYPDTSFAKEARALLRTIDRKELAGLPEVSEFLDSLPAAESPGAPSESVPDGPPVKSVSDPRVIEQG